MATIGIDLGTTSLKVCLVYEDKIIEEISKLHDANIPGRVGVQDAGKIVKCSEEILQEIWTNFTISHPGLACKQVRITGQMHGIVMWNGRSLTNGVIDCSPLYTWMYPHSMEKAATYPKPSRPVYPGFGSLSLFELPDYGNYYRCGTIMDLFACYLSRKQMVEMSWQLAESWGYCSDRKWDKSLIDVTTTRMVLPTIIDDDKHVIGNILVIPELKEVPILIPIGDLQGSVRSVADGNDDAAYLILGTSSQICMISTAPCDIPTVDRLPYSGDRCILAGRSMNGGNAVDAFLEMVNGWMVSLSGSTSGANNMNIGQLLDLADSESGSTSVAMRPVFIQERGLPFEGASISGLQRNTGIVEMIRSLCSGVIDNLMTLFPLKAMHSLGIRRLFLVGKAKKPRFARRIRELCAEVGIEAIDAENDTSAAYGAAVF